MEVCSHNCLDPNTVLLKINGVCCNLHCEYCSEIHKEFSKSMTAKECADIISRLPSSCEIILHGGEPLLNDELVVSAIRAFRANAKGRKLSVQTNGVIGERMKQILLENKDILKIGISIDGASEQNIMRKDHSGMPVFRLVDDTIAFFEENDIDIKCIATINSVNVNFPLDMVNYFMSHKNITQVRFNPCFDMEREHLAPHAVSPADFLSFMRVVANYWVEKRIYKIKRIDPLQSELEAILNTSNEHYMNCCKFVSVYPDQKYTICDAFGIELFHSSELSDIFSDARQSFCNKIKTPCNDCVEQNNCTGGCAAIFGRFNQSHELTAEYCDYRKGIKQLIKSLVSGAH